MSDQDHKELMQRADATILALEQSQQDQISNEVWNTLMDDVEEVLNALAHAREQAQRNNDDSKDEELRQKAEKISYALQKARPQYFKSGIKAAMIFLGICIIALIFALLKWGWEELVNKFM